MSCCDDKCGVARAYASPSTRTHRLRFHCCTGRSFTQSLRLPLGQCHPAPNGGLLVSQITAIRRTQKQFENVVVTSSPPAAMWVKAQWMQPEHRTKPTFKMELEQAAPVLIHQAAHPPPARLCSTHPPPPLLCPLSQLRFLPNVAKLQQSPHRLRVYFSFPSTAVF